MAKIPVNGGIQQGVLNTIAAGPSITNIGMPTSGGSSYASYYSQTVSGTISTNPSITSSCLLINGQKGEIVRVTSGGEVIWSDPKLGEPEAAQAFSKTLRLGAELSCGITDAVKREMRDIVFQEIIEIAKEDGPLDANQLIYMHRSAKIIDKLKGKF